MKPGRLGFLGEGYPASLLSMPVASSVATGTALRVAHPVASLLSMPVASCVATGTALRAAIRSLPAREGFFPLPRCALHACVPRRGTGVSFWRL